MSVHLLLVVGVHFIALALPVADAAFSTNPTGRPLTKIFRSSATKLRVRNVDLPEAVRLPVTDPTI